MSVPVSEDFERRVGRYRGELLVHCYQMLGSVHDAEDQVQETMVRAWRAYDRFDEARASMRTWLHRIATNTCLSALARDGRRPLPSGLAAPGADPNGPLVHGGEATWLQPFPEALLTGRDDPAAVLLGKGRLRLALVAAMQLLPARQRAVLILRDVLDIPAAEVAAALDTTSAAVNSALQRARARLAEVGVREDEVAESADRERRAVVDQYMTAFENADVDALCRLLAEDAVLEMPPYLNWYVGRDAYAGFIARVFATRGADWRMVPIASNGQPAVAAYVRAEHDVYRLHTIQVFGIGADGISRNVTFPDPEVFALFDIPGVLDAAAVPAAGDRA
jgi:RNA polymerase sigma-70 factor (ECF subfamily)